MDARRALELLDAHLDGEPLSEADSQALNVWIKQNERHADDAVRRMFLHAHLWRHLQPLPPLPGIDADAVVLPRRSPARQWWGRVPMARSTHPWLPVVLFAGLLAMGVGGWMVSRSGVRGNALVSQPFAYEPFDYPSPETPPSESAWPTEGGLNGLDGGHGFAGGWVESGSLVAIVDTNPSYHPWKPNDLRQFRALGYSDRFGNTLVGSGNKLRTSAGPYSLTHRKLETRDVPQHLRDGQALGADGSSLWISFLAQSFDSSGAGRYAYLQLGQDEAGLRIGKLRNVPSGNWSAAAVVDDVVINVRASDKPSGEAVLVVARLDFRPGPDQATIWINPDLNVEPGDADSVLRLPLPDFRIDTIVICGRYSTDFDEIRLGDTFRDVAPIVIHSVSE